MTGLELDELEADFRAALCAKIEPVIALSKFLKRIDCNAVGLWKVEEGTLVQIGFVPDGKMPKHVAEEFTAATRRVSLDQMGLGIVNAAVNQKPTIAKSLSRGGSLPGSGSWLDRFEALQSLSMPIVHDGITIGVLAVSANYFFDEEHESWQVTRELAERLASLPGLNCNA